MDFCEISLVNELLGEHETHAKGQLMISESLMLECRGAYLNIPSPTWRERLISLPTTSARHGCEKSQKRGGWQVSGASHGRTG